MCRGMNGAGKGTAEKQSERVGAQSANVLPGETSTMSHIPTVGDEGGDKGKGTPAREW